MADRLRVFVSSRMLELADERVAVGEALERAGFDAFVFEADVGARAYSAVETYRDALVGCDVYVGVFGAGWGDYTRDEYESALRIEMPALMYERDLSPGVERDPRLKAFLDTVGHAESGVTIGRYRDPVGLAEKVVGDVARVSGELEARFAGIHRYRPAGSLGGRIDLVEEPVVKDAGGAAVVLSGTTRAVR